MRPLDTTLALTFDEGGDTGRLLRFEGHEGELTISINSEDIVLNDISAETIYAFLHAYLGKSNDT